MDGWMYINAMIIKRSIFLQRMIIQVNIIGCAIQKQKQKQKKLQRKKEKQKKRRRKAEEKEKKEKKQLGSGLASGGLVVGQWLWLW